MQKITWIGLRSQRILQRHRVIFSPKQWTHDSSDVTPSLPHSTQLSLSPLTPADIFHRLSDHVVGQEKVKLALSVGAYKHLVGVKMGFGMTEKKVSLSATDPINDALFDRKTLEGFGMHKSQVNEALQEERDRNEGKCEGSVSVSEEVETSCGGVAFRSNINLASGKIVSQRSIDKTNLLIMGGTGTGKTLLAQTLADLIGVPMVIADATSLTQAGYVGEDVESVLAQLYARADYDMSVAERGIVYIDEIDKIARKSTGPTVSRDVSGEGVQQALLKLLEGCEVSIPKVGLKKKPGGDTVQMDTKNILFICAGSFAGIEHVVTRRREKEGLDDDDNDDLEVQNIDLIKFGLIPEFIGRFPIITGTSPLTVEELSDIIHRPKNAILKQYEYFFALHHMELVVTPAACCAIAEQTVNRGTGARGLKSIVEKLLTPVMFYLPANINSSKANMSHISTVPHDMKINNESHARYSHTALVDVDVVMGKSGVLLLHDDLSSDEYLSLKADGNDLFIARDKRIREVACPVSLMKQMRS